MPYDETEHHFEACGQRHITDAMRLLALPPEPRYDPDTCDVHLVGAMYVCGYAVECALKAYLIVQLDMAVWDEVLTALRDADVNLYGGQGHELRKLWDATDLPASPPEAVLVAWGICNRWDPMWRYDPYRDPTRAEAAEFVEAAHEFWAWVERERADKKGA